jgi:hypothetical protein
MEPPVSTTLESNREVKRLVSMSERVTGQSCAVAAMFRDERSADALVERRS